MIVQENMTRREARSASVELDASPRRSEVIRDAVLTVFGTLGIIVIAWLILAWACNLSVIVFVTGSMSPTMPAGSAAVVQTVAAADLKPGDVVTVPQPTSGLPVTHRIIDIDQPSANEAARSLTLKGDANPVADVNPYVVASAQRVLVAAPMTGWLVIWLKSPIVMVVITLCVAAAMTWGLWPTRSEKREA